MNLIETCNGCIHLSHTEAEQNAEYRKTGKKPDHYCKKYDRKLFHLNNHPNITKTTQCVLDGREL